MSTNESQDKPDTIQTDAESQEYGAQHGQDPRGRETGTSGSSEDGSAKTSAGGREDSEPSSSGEGTGARAGEYS